MNIEAFFNLTYGLYIVSAGNSDNKNGYIANTVFQVTAEPPQITAACNKNNLTAEIIQKSHFFSISVLQKYVDTELFGRFGYQSGRDINKFDNIDYIYGNSGTPIVIGDTIAWFECELTQTFDVGTHYLFVGRIMDSDLIMIDAEPLTYDYYRNVKNGKAPKNAPTYIKIEQKKEEQFMEKKKYECAVCKYIYDPEIGDPDGGITPGTAFDDIPEDWVCPVCGASKEDFEVV